MRTKKDQPGNGPGVSVAPHNVPARRSKHMRGFTLPEVLITMMVIVVLAAIAIPSIQSMVQSYRTAESARGIASQLSLARMRAASAFKQTELNCSSATNSCQVQVCSAAANPCAAFSPAAESTFFLPVGISFGYGNIATAAGTQTAIANNLQMIFNSRGIPVDTTGAPTANYAMYVTDQGGNAFAVSVYATGRVTVWKYIGNAWSAQ